MTTTTGDPSSLKTPATLSGGDLVARLLAATPPYLYNVPLTPHSFFFSEMLRSFVQSKAEASTSGGNNATGSGAVRRRKRSWRDARERPLELTTKEKPQSNGGSSNNNGAHHHPHHSHHHHHHHHQQHQQHLHQSAQQQQKDKYYPVQQQAQIQQTQQRTTPPDIFHPDNNRFKSHSGVPEETTSYANEAAKRVSNYERRASPYTVNDSHKIADENRADFCKQARDFYDDSSRRFSSEQSVHREALFGSTTLKVKPEESPTQQQSQPMISDGKNREATPDDTPVNDDRSKNAQDSAYLAEQKSKLQEFNGRNFLPGLPSLEEQPKTFGLSGLGVPNATDFLPSGPLWYPPYPAIPQTYPGIDPLHFFIDLRVSGHIWDRKINERQLPFKSKHCSAFSVPQAKEYNRPLDLTRDEATTSSNTGVNNGTANQRGTHFILRHLGDTYKDIRDMEKIGNNAAESVASSDTSSPDDSAKDSQGRSLPNSEIPAGSSSAKDNRQQKEEKNEGKDLRALIGLELVVDYVKEPKEDPSADEEQPPVVSE